MHIPHQLPAPLPLPVAPTSLTAGTTSGTRVGGDAGMAALVRSVSGQSTTDSDGSTTSLRSEPSLSPRSLKSGSANTATAATKTSPTPSAPAPAATTLGTIANTVAHAASTNAEFDLIGTVYAH